MLGKGNRLFEAGVPKTDFTLVAVPGGLAVRCSTSPSSHTPVVSLTIYMIPIMYITR
jgi:hypothetical protein